MNLSEAVIEGTLHKDRTLILDKMPNLPLGRVQVIVQPLPELPEGDPFWDTLKAIWAGQKERGHLPRSVEEVEAEQRQTRQGWAKRQEAIERLQDESRRLREEPS